MHRSLSVLKSALAMPVAAVALVAASLALAGPSTALGQEVEECEVTDLGTLGDSAGSVLEAEGRWTTEDCDSRFRPDSDAHTFRFHVAEAGRIRVGLSSPEGDSYLYLLAEDGSRITDNDDHGERLDARVESDLEPGAYLIEATTVGGRGRGPADFKVTVSRVEGCDLFPLGELEPGKDLVASGSWSLDTCGSRFVSSHPAQGYLFFMDQPGRVRIDLESENGDPVLSLASFTDGIVGANDDGGEYRNSRIEQYLQAGAYLIEATTYYARDRQPLQADFTLTVHFVEEPERQQSPELKVEAVHIPAEVVAGDPFPVDFRVGNAGGGELPDDGSVAHIYVVGRGVFDRLDPLAGVWDAGSSYHSSDVTASASSTAIDEVAPFEATFNEHGPKWLFVGAVTDDADGNEVGFHGLWHNLLVLSGPTFGPVKVKVGLSHYTVTAEADMGDESLVTTVVKSVSDPAAEVARPVQRRAIYTAGVLSQLLDGVFERPAIADLPEGSDRERFNVINPSSSTLMRAFGQQYAASLSGSGLLDAWLAREAIDPAAIEQLWLDAADTASARYASMAAEWRSLLNRSDDESQLSFHDARTVQSQVAYVESLVAATAAAGEVVAAARSAADGWDDPDVQALMAEQSDCRPGGDALRGALEAAGAGNIDEMLALDAELRLERPVHGLAVDQALCGAESADAALSRFLERLGLDDGFEIREVLGLAPLECKDGTSWDGTDCSRPSAAMPQTQQLRIIARLGDDGRVEHGVELADGERILPETRFLSADAAVGSWRVSGDVEVDGTAVGSIRARRVAGGRYEVGFIGADGEAITPHIAFLPADARVGVWYRSSEIEVSAVGALQAADSADD